LVGGGRTVIREMGSEERGERRERRERKERKEFS
jgi:hypothetical protein